MKRIGIIVNLNSRKYKLAKKCDDCYEKLGGDYVMVRYTHSIDEIADVATEFKSAGMDYIAPCGGDGTLHHVITQFNKIYQNNLPPFLILKGGTMNNVATSINLKGDAESILKRAIETIKADNALPSIKRKTMSINNTYCFLFGNGLVADFLERYYTIGKSYTKLVKLIYNSIVEALFNKNSNFFKGFDGSITCDRQTLPYANVLGLLAGTVETVGMGFYPLYRANEKNDSFHVIVCAMDPKDLAKNIVKLKKGTPIRHEKFYENTVKTIEIHSDKPFAYTMDGDLYYAEDTLQVTTGINIHFVVV